MCYVIHAEEKRLTGIKIALAELLKCCHSQRWATEMAAHSFPNVKEVFATADSIWWGLAPSDWHEAFAAHPRMGEKSSTSSAQQPYALRHASAEALAKLLETVMEYEEYFGFRFIASSAGKSAEQLAGHVKERMTHSPAAELRLAAEQEREIIHARLKMLLAR